MKINEIIRKLENGKYRLYSKKGKNLGTFDSKSGAEKHEREVQYFKHMSEDEDAHLDMLNPMPVSTDGDIWAIMDEADEEIADEYPDVPFKQRFDKVAKTMMVPMNAIVSTEPRLSRSHIKAIINGNVSKQSSDLPRFYTWDGKYYASDGNHRVVAAYLKGEKSIRGNVVDAYKPLGE